MSPSLFLAAAACVFPLAGTDEPDARAAEAPSLLHQAVVRW